MPQAPAGWFYYNRLLQRDRLQADQYWDLRQARLRFSSKALEAPAMTRRIQVWVCRRGVRGLGWWDGIADRGTLGALGNTIPGWFYRALGWYSRALGWFYRAGMVFPSWDGIPELWDGIPEIWDAFESSGNGFRSNLTYGGSLTYGSDWQGGTL